MKKIFLITVLLLQYLGGYSQNNSLFYNELTINGFSLNTNEAILINQLNLTNSPFNYYDEYNDETYVKYESDFSDFSFKDNKLIDFNLNESNYYFMNTNIKVAANISIIQSLYPLSFGNKYRKNGVGFIEINLKLDDGSITDEFIIINYNINNNIITSIFKADL